MRKITVYILGIVLGIILVLLTEVFSGLTITQVWAYYSNYGEHTNFALGSGDVPDFSVKPVPVNIYEEIDPEWGLSTPDQEKMLFQSMKGKVLFLSRWATWCGPCITEMPDIAKLQDKLASDDVVFMLYTDENEHIVQGFDNETDLPIYVSIGSIPEFLHVASLPQTFIIDKKGILRYVHSGTAHWGDKTAVAFMTELIAE